MPSAYRLNMVLRTEEKEEEEEDINQEIANLKIVPQKKAAMELITI